MYHNLQQNPRLNLTQLISDISFSTLTLKLLNTQIFFLIHVQMLKPLLQVL